MRRFAIQQPDEGFIARLRETVDQKTKPIGALGVLEDLAVQIGSVLRTARPELKPHFLVFAADHGIAKDGVSAYPREVTSQMVRNFASGGAAINVFCKQHGIPLDVIDAGVDADLSDLKIIHRKTANGTRNFRTQDAMTTAEFEQTFETGMSEARRVTGGGANVVGFGEMGIGNSSAAALIFSRLLNLPLDVCVGRGTGLDDVGLKRKLLILKQASDRSMVREPDQVLTAYGGFEIVMMCAGMLAAAESGALILIDGYIATAAFVAAYRMAPAIRGHAIFCHQSAETGHAPVMEALSARALLNLGMRLGEGSGAAVAYPLVASAAAFLREMASFASAGVSEAQ